MQASRAADAAVGSPPTHSMASGRPLIGLNLPVGPKNGRETVEMLICGWFLGGWKWCLWELSGFLASKVRSARADRPT